MLKDLFGFSEDQGKATYGLGYKLTPTRNEDDAVLPKAVAIADAKIQIDHIHWYKPHYTPSIQQQGILSEKFLSKTPTKLKYVQRSVFMKEVNNEDIWNFELSSEESMIAPIWITIGFQQCDRQDSQISDNCSFCRLNVVSAQFIIGTEKNPDASISIIYNDDVYSQGYAQFR